MPNKKERLCLSFLFGWQGLEPIAEQLSGGQFLQPVQKLVATLIFAKGKNAYQVLSPVSKNGEFLWRLAGFLSGKI